MRKKILIIAIFIFLLTNISIAAGNSIKTNQNTWSSTIVVFNSEIHEIDYNITLFGLDGGEGYVSEPEQLKSFASKTILVGNTFQDSDAAGSAIVVSDFPLGVIYRSSEEVTKNPVFYSALDLTRAGYKFFVPEINKNIDYKTLIGVQNAANYPITINLSFYRTDGSVIVVSPPSSINPNRSIVFDTSDPAFSELGDNFTGSLVVTSSGILVVAVQQIQTNGSGAFSYEGVSSGAPAVFAANVMCQYGPRTISSFIRAQNTSANPSSIYVDYYDSDGNFISNQESGIVPPFSSFYFSACDPVENQRSSMTAVIHSENVAAIVKSTDGSSTMSAVYTAQRIQEKSDFINMKYRVLIPFIQWSRSDKGYQTYISVMNVSNQASKDIQINFYQQSGELISKTALAGLNDHLAPYGKRDINPNASPGLLSGNRKDFIGAAVIISDQPISAIVRIQRDIVSPAGEFITFGEDYSGTLDNTAWNISE
jgi:hypothetical protein